MTAIVGFVDAEKTVWIGGDSAGVRGTSLLVRRDTKVFESHGFLYGFTTSFRMGQLIRYKFRPPERFVDQDLPEYMATHFIDGLRQCLQDGGYSRKENNVETGGTFLVGTQGRLFCIENDYQVAEAMTPFHACGCGEDVALGCLYAIHQQEACGSWIVHRALEAAATFSSAVAPPFVVQSLKHNGMI